MKKMFLFLVVAAIAMASFQTAKASEECEPIENICFNAYVPGGTITITKCNGCEEILVSEASLPGCCN